MHMPAGERCEAEVARHHQRLRRRRDSGEPEPCGELSLVHRPSGGERGLLRVLHDHRAEAAGIGEGKAHGSRIGDRAPSIAEGDRTRLLEQPHLGEFAPRTGLGRRRAGQDGEGAEGGGASGDELDERGFVERRVGVG